MLLLLLLLYLSSTSADEKKHIKIINVLWTVLYLVVPFSSPEPMILLVYGRNRELWEEPFQACAIDADCMRPDGQNLVISFIISKWLLPELLIPATGQKDRRLWGRECSGTWFLTHDFRGGGGGHSPLLLLHHTTTICPVRIYIS